MQVDEMDENYLFEYNGPPLIIFEDIILNKYDDVYLIYQDSDKEIALFTGNRKEETIKNF
jgi:hypothetical protein